MKTVWLFAVALAVLALGSPAHAQDASMLDEVRLKDGRVLHGRVVSEGDASLVLCLPDGTAATVERSELYALMRSESVADGGAVVCAPPVVVVPPPEILEGPEPEGKHLELVRPHPGLAAAGVGTLATGYLLLITAMFGAATAFGGTTNGDFGSAGNWLYLPVVGPLVCGALVDKEGLSPLLIGSYIADEVVQLAGVAMFVAYFLLPKQRAWVPDEDAHWSLAPGAGRSPLGVTFSVAGW